MPTPLETEGTPARCEKIFKLDRLNSRTKGVF